MERDFSLLQDAVQAEKTVLVGIGGEWGNAPDETVCRAYAALAGLLRWTNYFVLTTNTDDRIYKAGLDAGHIVAPFGSVNRFQCPNGCAGAIWTKETMPVDGVCPHCGKPLVTNTKGAAVSYLEEGYLSQWQAYTEWLTHTLNRGLTILELGVGFEEPTVLRWPFERIAFLNQKARLYRVNGTWPQLSQELAASGRAYSVKRDSCELFADSAAGTDKREGGSDGGNQQ